MKNGNPQISKRDAQTVQEPAVVIYELTDPSVAGEDIEILDQDVVHLGSKPFSARRVVVNLDKSMFVLHSVSHRTRSHTRVHPAMMVFLIVGRCREPLSTDGMWILTYLWPANRRY